MEHEFCKEEIGFHILMASYGSLQKLPQECPIICGDYERMAPRAGFEPATK